MRPELLERIVATRVWLLDSLIVDGADHAHGIVPVHERGHDHGTDHDHVHVHVHVSG